MKSRLFRAILFGITFAVVFSLAIIVGKSSMWGGLEGEAKMAAIGSIEMTLSWFFLYVFPHLFWFGILVIVFVSDLHLPTQWRKFVVGGIFLFLLVVACFLVASHVLSASGAKPEKLHKSIPLFFFFVGAVIGLWDCFFGKSPALNSRAIVETVSLFSGAFYGIGAAVGELFD